MSFSFKVCCSCSLTNGPPRSFSGDRNYREGVGGREKRYLQRTKEIRAGIVDEEFKRNVFRHEALVPVPTYSTYPLIRTYFFRFSLNGFLCKWCLVEF